MSEEYYTEFYKGDLITLRDGIDKYPYFESLELFNKNPKLNIHRFGSEQLVVLNKVYDKSNMLIGYECLCYKEKIFVMNMSINQGDKLDVGFCYVNS